jgi:hypothetical protein
MLYCVPSLPGGYYVVGPLLVGSLGATGGATVLSAG